MGMVRIKSCGCRKRMIWATSNGEAPTLDRRRLSLRSFSIISVKFRKTTDNRKDRTNSLRMERWSMYIA
jgi:hypothetical protein